ncbi:MBL fold metallo-hydrolase [Pseudoalteromonas tunicata]|uniref:MBL fold metallo-hydrolase n=1 Tax=Pseudoalteromonas tunicata TaxID=314281 RepID=UPI00273E2E9F|nr:MBL fold metallo-hydrolase [Pseudoalteromonas tunicata]MDP4982275.1 MBL fold metallo-hydrolase [Pseudoalteromonas tunicata]
MHVIIEPVTAFAQNCSLLICEQSAQAVMIDPGGDPQQLIALTTKQGCKVVKIILTHGHLDHVGAAKELAEYFQVDIIGPHHDDQFWLDALPQQAQMFGFNAAEPFLPTSWLVHQQRVHFGEQELEVRHCPGHTPGHVVLISHQDKFVIAGDVLFKGSIGRTDFPKGNQAQLVSSIKQQLFDLPDSYVVYPGHGPITTIGDEKRHNPFLSGRFG